MVPLNSGRFIIVLALAFGPPAAAQDKPDPSTDPALNDPGVLDRVRDLEREPAKGLRATTEPTETRRDQADSRSAVRRVQLANRAPPRREGSFLVRQPGSLVRLESGEWLLTFHRDPDGQAERPMVLMRSQDLERLEGRAGANPEKPTFVVSGQVFLYRGVNYLLLSAFRELVPVGHAPEPPAEARDESSASAELDAVMRELESQRLRPGGLGSTPPSSTGEAPSRAALADGAMLVRRRGRMVRAPDGEMALVIDSDADSRPGLDPVLLLAPCQSVERMEQLALSQGEAMVFEVTGRVLAYRGRNYLIPTLFQSYPPSELQRRH